MLHVPLRRAVAVDLGKLITLASRWLGKGGGTTLPGLVAQHVDPELVPALISQLACGSVVVSGTNGKTTTTRMVTAILEHAGYRVVRNAAGSNLMRGVATALVNQATWGGNLPRQRQTIGVFEVDEAAFSTVVPVAKPETLVLLNLFRDQLDRYGEVATIARIWQETLHSLPPKRSVVANADDPLVANVVMSAPHITPLWFSLEVPGCGAPEYASDVKACPRCSGPITYRRWTYGHLGDYTCTCGFKRPQPAVIASIVEQDGINSTTFTLTAPDRAQRVSLPLPGLYNVMNAVAAAAAAISMGVSVEHIESALSSFTAAFGRLERIPVEGRMVYLLLAKNPTGYNQVLRTLFSDPNARRHVVFMLNDNTADGRDVSWIWDVDFESVVGRLASVIFAGRRAEDMALRLKYAGLPCCDAGSSPLLAHGAEPALHAALATTQPGDDLYIIMTYTAMLEMRNTLTRLGYAPPYWEE
jgi:UDP-N-acetylmuramyl tripeptide synthase